MIENINYFKIILELNKNRFPNHTINQQTYSIDSKNDNKTKHLVIELEPDKEISEIISSIENFYEKNIPGYKKQKEILNGVKNNIVYPLKIFNFLAEISKKQ